MKLFNWRTRVKTAAPTVPGNSVETLSSHATDPNAHPSFLRKGDAATSSDRPALERHKLTATDHAKEFARRAELLTTKDQYEAVKASEYGKGLPNDSTNYMKETDSPVDPYIVTAYVLNQILAGLERGISYERLIKSTTSPLPAESVWDNYIPSYKLYRTLKTFVDEQCATKQWVNEQGFLTDTEAAKKYLTIKTASETYVSLDKTETIKGTKTFESSPVVPDVTASSTEEADLKKSVNAKFVHEAINNDVKVEGLKENGTTVATIKVGTSTYTIKVNEGGYPDYNNTVNEITSSATIGMTDNGFICWKSKGNVGEAYIEVNGQKVVSIIQPMSNVGIIPVAKGDKVVFANMVGNDGTSNKVRFLSPKSSN